MQIFNWKFTKIILNMKTNLKTFNYKCRKELTLWGLLLKKNYSRDITGWRIVLYFTEKHRYWNCEETASWFRRSLVYSKYSVSHLGWFPSKSFPKNFGSPIFVLSPPLLKILSPPSFLLIPPPKLQNVLSSIPFEIVRLLLRCWHINKSTQ